MLSRSLLAALLASQIAAGIALAQSTSDFLRGSGGEIELLGKHSSSFSGSLGINIARSQFPFASGTSKGYVGTLGGTIVPDRLWFFASAEQSTPLSAQTQIVNVPVIRQINTNLGAQLGDRQNLGATFAAASQFNPNAFLSMHYTGIVSANSYFTATISRSRH